jgi:hypothetical protein
MESPWRILWALYGDYGLKPDDIEMMCDGLAGDFAHVRWSAYETKDPYSDVIVHETAHLLHYLKPRNFGLHVHRHQERFVDVEFRHRELFAFACEAYSRVVLRGERKSRLAFAEKMQESAFSFPPDQLAEVAALVLEAARARNGWRVIREATVIRRTQRRNKAVPCRKPNGQRPFPACEVVAPGERDSAAAPVHCDGDERGMIGPSAESPGAAGFSLRQVSLARGLLVLFNFVMTCLEGSGFQEI